MNGTAASGSAESQQIFLWITNNRYTRVYAPLGMRELKIETAEGEIYLLIN